MKSSTTTICDVIRITKNTASDFTYKSEYKYPLYQKTSNAVFFIYKKKNSVQQETGTVNRAKK